MSATSSPMITPDQLTLRAELQAGLLASKPHISPKFLYDELGSRLFDAICLLPEYYLTRTESAIFASNMPHIADCLGQGVCLIEPGAGNCSKAARMFAQWQPTQYVAIDISATYLDSALQSLRMTQPEIDILGLGMDFSHELRLPETVQHEKRVFFYPGSSIGNFTPSQALDLLTRMRAACQPDQVSGILIGVDLRKDTAILEAAYDDSLGLTAAFNLNLLRHASGLLEMDVDLNDWRHQAFFNVAHSRIEMHLLARRDLRLQWRAADSQEMAGRDFAAGSSIHTENSYKYTVQGMQALLRDAGFAPQQVWQDEKAWFALMYARAI